ncbi:tyrosine-type recombinase/integrase, partial [Halorhodospira abdelmalekii]|uniref:tyrosine-type recombinase/integrase n=1 Tax=Halorhodospira abdelmalekii TaxID=421629 RepID=UPI003B848508
MKLAAYQVIAINSTLFPIWTVDIDGERKLLRIAQGKGAKDRLVVLSPSLLEALRAYWRLYRPREWLFPSRDGTPLSPTSLQKAFTEAK